MRALRYLLIAFLFTPFLASAQNSLDLTINDVGLSIGDSREVTGVRLNYRDSRMRRVTGVNATIWMPYDGRGGDVKGFAIGLPATGADNIEGVAWGILGAGANNDISLPLA